MPVSPFNPNPQTTQPAADRYVFHSEPFGVKTEPNLDRFTQLQKDWSAYIRLYLLANGVPAPLTATGGEDGEALLQMVEGLLVASATIPGMAHNDEHAAKRAEWYWQKAHKVLDLIASGKYELTALGFGQEAPAAAGTITGTFTDDSAFADPGFVDADNVHSDESTIDPNRPSREL